MENFDLRNPLERFNSIYREMDGLYHSLARHYGLSDCAFWIFYVIRETGKSYNQSQLCEMLSMSKQTINSALKSLENADFIRLEIHGNNKKSKEIRLTDSGLRFASQTMDAVMSMEQNAFKGLSTQEHDALFHLLEAYLNRLKMGAQEIFSQSDLGV